MKRLCTCAACACCLARMRAAWASALSPALSAARLRLAAGTEGTAAAPRLMSAGVLAVAGLLLEADPAAHCACRAGMLASMVSAALPANWVLETCTFLSSSTIAPASNTQVGVLAQYCCCNTLNEAHGRQIESS